MHIVEIAVSGHCLVDGVAKLGGRRRAVEFDLHRPWRCRGDGEQQIGIVGAPRADEEHRGAAEMGERGAMRGEALVQRAGGDVDVAQELARLQHVGVVAGDEVDGRDLARGAVARQKRVAGLERGGERHHRASRQRHADIAADRRRVPDLERGEKGAGAELKQRRRDPVGRRLEMVQFGDGAGRRDIEACLRRLKRRPLQGPKIDERVSRDLRGGEQPGAPGKPGIAWRAT